MRTASPTGIAPLEMVHNSVYLDPAVFALEQERLFGRVWNFVCHECELPAPGDYLAREVAGSPMVIVRDSQGRLHALYNTCTHRGCQVVEEGRGHRKTLLCPYHNWNFGLDGRLLGVPGLAALEGTGFCKEAYGLRAARVESVYGLVFVCQDPAAPSLHEYLGPALVSLLARPFAHSELELMAYRRTELEVNWKTGAENARDGYHVPNVHPFFKRASVPRPYHLHGCHAVQELAVRWDAIDVELAQGMRDYPLPGLGPDDGYVAGLFPDTFILVRSNFVFIESQIPVAPELTIIEDRGYGLRGDPPSVREQRLRSWEVWAANIARDEDFPVLRRQQRGLRSRQVTRAIIARRAPAGGRALGQSNLGDDERLRAFWAHWRAYLDLEQNAAPGATLD